MNTDADTSPGLRKDRVKAAVAVGIVMTVSAVAGTVLHTGHRPTALPPAPVSGVVCHGTHYTLTAEIHAGS